MNRPERPARLPRTDGAPPVHAAAHARHRAAFLAALGGDAALIFGASLQPRNGDADFRFRQNSDVLYLSGWKDPECALLFRPGAEQPFILFVQPRDAERETWTGRRAGPEGAEADYGADLAIPIGELSARLPELLQGYRTLHYRFAEDAERDRALVAAIGAARRLSRKSGLDVPDAFIDPARVLHELRLIKSEDELEILRSAAKITADAHLEAMAISAPGAMEYELEAVIEAAFRRGGGSGAGYTSIVAAGDNATILHYHTNQDVLRDGDLIVVDAGGEFDGYTADVTRTWPVNGRFSDLQRRAYEVVLDAQLLAIDACRAGRRFLDPHEVATRRLTKGMVELGLFAGDPEDSGLIDQLIADGRSKRYYMHGTSHWLGLDVHDVGVYNREGGSRPLLPGMVLTVEPGLYVPADDAEAPDALRGLGIRIEDDVVVTDGEPLVLTAAIPKSVEAVEAAVGLRAGGRTA
jgi:Xaa-Pro aminopeptidase